MPDPSNLITIDVATAALSAGGIVLTDAQTAWIPTAITAASGAIARYCSRSFVATDYDDVVIPRSGQWDRGEPDTVKLQSMPINSVSRVAGGRTTALTVANTDSSTNQRATLQYTFTGDPETQLTFTGITLSRTASGITTTSPLTFADNVTISALASSVNALGNGWTAAVTNGYALYPTADLFGTVGPVGCLTLSQAASLTIFASDLSSYNVDYKAGIVSLYSEYGQSNGASDPYLWPGSAADNPIGAFRSPIRIAYNAGFSTIPAPIQQACCEVVKNILERLTTDSTLQSETDGAYSYTSFGPLAFECLTMTAKTLLAMYRTPSA